MESPTSVPPAITSAIALDRWQALKDHLARWYSDPDFEAVEICFCVYVSHLFLQDDPVWLFVVGPPSTGKTEIAIRVLSALPRTHLLGDLTTKTFLSGFGRGAPRYSLLHNVAPADSPSAVLLFKDFTTFLSKREETRKELASQLREIHDGYLPKREGTIGRALDWRGKITVVAASTPALDRCWGLLRELGDRFLTVRWPRGNGLEMAWRAERQIGMEREIRAEMERLARAFADPTGMRRAEGFDDVTLQQAGHVVELASILRTPVTRDGYGQREILAVSEAEGSSRLMKGLCQSARARATLYRRARADLNDLKAVQRAVLQSVPPARLRIIECIPRRSSAKMVELEELTGLFHAVLYREVEELVTIGVLRLTGQAQYGFTEPFQSLFDGAFPGT